MRRTGPLTRLAALLALLFAVAACDGSSDPLPEPLSFTGELAPKGSVEHTFRLAESGVIEVELTALDARDTATGVVSDLPAALRFGLGRPDTDPDDEDGSKGEDETEEDFCDETLLAGVAEGSRLVLRLEDREYCLSLADLSGTTIPAIPDGKVALYTLTATATE